MVFVVSVHHGRKGLRNKVVYFLAARKQRVGDRKRPVKTQSRYTW